MRFPLLSSRSLVLLAAAVVALVWPRPEPAAAQKGKVAVETVAYQGWKNNLRLSNGDAELIATLDVGPRIISYRLAGGKNVFKEYPGQMGKTGETEWMIRGGLRLWVAPEDTTRTYYPDNQPVAYKVLDEQQGRVRLIPPPEKQYGLQKEVDVQLAPKGSRVTLVYRITNIGSAATELAPWPVTVLRGGGVEVIPLPAKKPHPGHVKNAKSPADFAPNQTMILWPYFDFKDPRWTFGSKYLTLRHDAGRGPTKLGLAHRMGWVGYLDDGTLFVRSIGYQEGKPYPDNGCNFETFTNEDMLEIESLGPLVKLAAGAAVELSETWDLVDGIADFKDEAGIEKALGAKVPGK